MTPVGTCVLALLADECLLETWLAALRRSPKCRGFVALVESPPATAVSAPSLAKLAHVGERVLRRSVLHATGLTPVVMIASLKLERAIRRLGRGSSIKAIASDEGFSSSAFDHHFRRHLGTSPLKFELPPHVPSTSV
jgi:transcriptional regulator GlxA family with amidase domain